MKRGISVIELAVAFAIVGLAVVPVLSLLGSTARQTTQTSSYSLAVALAQKVAEELRQAAWENVHAASVVQAHPDFGVPLPVTNGTSPFFATLEDDRAPFGETLTGSDTGIGPEHGALYRQLRTFTLQPSATPAVLTSGTAVDLNLQLAWEDAGVSGRKLALPVRLPHRAHVANRPREVQDRDEADARVAALLFSAPAPSLAVGAAQRRADVQALRCLGDAVLVSLAFTASTQAFQDALTVAERSVTAATTPLATARARLLVARIHERRAAQCMQVAGYLLEPLRTLAGIDLARLGTPRPDPAQLVPALIALRGVNATFAQELTRARDTYAAVYAAPLSLALRPRQRMRVLCKLLDLTKLTILAIGPADTAPLAAVLAELERLQQGRNVNFAQFARFEARRCADIATLRESYPGTEYRALAEVRGLAREAARKVQPE